MYDNGYDDDVEIDNRFGSGCPEQEKIMSPQSKEDAIRKTLEQFYTDVLNTVYKSKSPYGGYESPFDNHYSKYKSVMEAFIVCSDELIKQGWI